MARAKNVAEKKQPLNPKTTKFEFGGFFGALFLSLFLPVFTVFINLQLTPDAKFSTDPFYYLNPCRSAGIWIPYLCWFGGLAVFDIILPGKTMFGTLLRDDTKLKYKINGISNSFLLILILGLRWQITEGAMPELVFLYEHHVELNIISVLFAFYLATYCYLKSFIYIGKEPILALGGNSSNVIYDWFIGRELNPRIGCFDIKLFCELRPGMLLWLLINLSCLHHNYVVVNQFQSVNDALLLINILQGFYIFDGVLNEEGLLTMMDIATDGFGFMLSFGDLTFVPFTFCLQARFLSVNANKLGQNKVIFITSLMALGYYIFHSANKQKSDFKQGKLPNLKSIQTKRGTKLLCDSWWGMSQHINYMGDWLISLSWCLTTWFVTPLTYHYSAYFAILLFHRQKRDEEKCSEKYGDDWVTYQKKVPYKIIPYVY
ncbi:similar to Saccharomyces cerevisiae YNL280C ERG24 C-14 sterol reductase, acts in ergosterol biosynthesis [Maudiozyma saulgeensis]|uniref:Delta(14)-sterol reductase n=1 Tax=Maudiozyma saulgeensis TaxID=1789683 RepID=A0A1X7R255_9SACH|nr:similar to Saccharomyces cerevisiae YNL280C ERG24 C-14 sterol reductase, acts in ergosterol biosynthesis [Kazachstania saulgeensis]